MKNRNQNSQFPPTSSSYPIIKIFFLNIAIILFLIASFEVYLRSDKRFDHYKNDAQFTHGVKTHLNSLGYRDEEFSEVIKSDGSQTLIFAAGGSNTYGSGVPWENVFVKRVQYFLNHSQTEKEYYAINGGGQGKPIREVIDQINELNLGTFPKIIILSISAPIISKMFELSMKNPVGLDNSKTLDSPLFNLKWIMEDFFLSLHVWLHHHTRSYAFIDQELRTRLFKMKLMKERLDKINGAMMAYAFQTDKTNEAYNGLILKTYDRIEEKISSIHNEANSTLILMGIPMRFMISDNAIDNLRNIDKEKMKIDPMEKIKLMAEKHGILYADLKKRLVRERKNMASGKTKWNDLYIQNDYAHLNARGHELAAEVLFKILQANGL